MTGPPKPPATLKLVKPAPVKPTAKPRPAPAKPAPRAGPAPGALARVKWESSGLTDERAAQLHLRELSAPETANLAPNFVAARSLLIPYFDLAGNLTSFFRVRYLEPLPGFAGQVRKPQRYAQPAGTLNEVYYPPLLDRPWVDIAEDTNTTIYITEGEFKAAAACAHGLACLGLGGVDVWRSTKRLIDFFETLKLIDWRNREVVLAFDSDADTNPDVVRAQLRLAREVTDRGARPAIAVIPPKADGGKQGLDDLVVAQGAEALKAILAVAPAFPEAEALHRLNTEVAYIERPGVYLAQEDGFLMNRDKFMNDAFAGRHYRQTETKNKQVVVKEKPLAPRWIQWPGRFTLNRITYAPGGERVVIEHEKRCWNRWPGWGCEPKEGDVSMWHRLLDHVFQGKQEEREWFERWVAYPLQHPGVKIFTAAVLWGQHTGTGKTFLGELLCRIYGEKNAVAVGKDDLKGDFNSLFVNRQFVQGEEITGDESRRFADKLKTLITQESMVVREKYIPEYTVPTCANYLFTSNHDDAFFLDSADRRFFIHEVTAPGAGTPGGLPDAFWTSLNLWKEGDGPAHLFHYLLSLDLGGFDPRARAPMTEAKMEMVAGSRSPLDSWCHQLFTGEVEVGAFGCDLLRASEVCDFYKQIDQRAASYLTPERTGLALKRAGFRKRVVSLGDRHRHLYATRDRAEWEARTDEEWQAERTEFERKTAQPKKVQP